MISHSKHEKNADASKKKSSPPRKRKKNTKNHTIFEVKVQDVPSASLDLPLLVPVAAQRPATGFFLKKTPRLFHKNHRLGNLRAPQDFLTQESSLSNYPHYPHHPHLWSSLYLSSNSCHILRLSLHLHGLKLRTPVPWQHGNMATCCRKTKSFKGVTCVKPCGGGSSTPSLPKTCCFDK